MKPYNCIYPEYDCVGQDVPADGTLEDEEEGSTPYLAERGLGSTMT
jgi:hypothetical protein